MARWNKNPNYVKLMSSAQWQHTRNAYMASVGWLCEDCKEVGKITAAQEVHHIIPLERFRTFHEMSKYAFDVKNLRALCRQCHAAAHRRLGSHTRRAQKERDRTAMQEFLQKFVNGGVILENEGVCSKSTPPKSSATRDIFTGCGGNPRKKARIWKKRKN